MVKLGIVGTQAEVAVMGNEGFDFLLLIGVVFIYCLAYRWKYGTPKQQTPKGYDWNPNPNYQATQVIQETSRQKKQSQKEQLAPGQRVFIPIPLGNEAPTVELPVRKIRGSNSR